MKKTSKALAMLLAVIMLVSCISVSAFAATAETVRQYGDEGDYIAFGDSVSRGCGATVDYEDQHYYDYEFRTVKNSFPTTIAYAVGCDVIDDASVIEGNNYWPVCYVGQTVTELMEGLGIEDNYYDTDYDFKNRSVARVERWYGENGGILQEKIKTASLITVELGMCDVFYRAKKVASDTASMDDDMLGWVKTDVSETYKGYKQWLKSYELFLQWIRSNNDKATVVLVGVYNSSMNMTLTDDMLLPVGSALSTISDLMNMQYKKWAEEYDCIFVDISNVDTVTSQYNWSLTGDDFKENKTIGGHPSPEGNSYMAREILNALPVAEGQTEVVKNKTDIVIDLGRFQKVDSVYVNGIQVKNYSMDGYVLTVPYGTAFAKTITVTVKQDDGKTAIYKYNLWYGSDGYTAYRTYSVNDAEEMGSRVFRTATNAVNKAVSAIKGLFK